MILAGQVRASVAGQWEPLKKPAQKVDESIELYVELGEEQKYVSRAGLKLEGALQHLRIDNTFQWALDIGQSTGGFTDCLLRYGVSRVVGVDVGRDQLVSRLREDSRVVCLEKINARTLSPQILQDVAGQSTFDVVVMDVSFISQTLILPQVPALMNSEALLISLVKPQFEVGSEGLGKGGIVKNDVLYEDVKNKLVDQVAQLGLSLVDYFESRIRGGDGNREFFICAQKQQ